MRIITYWKWKKMFTPQAEIACSYFLPPLVWSKYTKHFLLVGWLTRLAFFFLISNDCASVVVVNFTILSVSTNATTYPNNLLTVGTSLPLASQVLLSQFTWSVVSHCWALKKNKKKNNFSACSHLKKKSDVSLININFLYHQY